LGLGARREIHERSMRPCATSSTRTRQPRQRRTAGEEAWRAAPELAAVLDANAELLEATRPLVPHLRFVLDDLSAQSIDGIAARTLSALGRMVQMALWSARSHKRLLEAAPLMQRIAEHAGGEAGARELLVMLYTYLLKTSDPEVDPGEVRTILEQIAGPEGQELVMNAAEHLIAQGRAEGERTGLERGRLDGLRSAIEAALAARGVALSAVGRARLVACGDAAMLSAWVARAVVASSETDVFA
jgi:hypothetical protein